LPFGDDAGDPVDGKILEPDAGMKERRLVTRHDDP
jgi:hypothetical protein